ncbi:MAG: glycogen synthase [Myxococcaceae bacterium]|nr:MAG: glycogen synthase [Myxococcaceae bacterium]
MKVLFVSSEVAPFAKTGGLGDVSAALPRQLHALGHDVRVVVPMYARVHDQGRTFTEVIPEMVFSLGELTVRVGIFAATLPGAEVPVYFVRCPSLYDRPNIYDSGGDEHLRFAVLNQAALRLCQLLRFGPDIIHVNDWQTCLIPLLLRTLFAWDQLFARTRTVLTIHNLSHQGTFDAGRLASAGLAQVADRLHQDHLREGRFSFLLTGILYANAITTVSPTYAREIQTPEHGVGLDGFLRSRADVLRGILNGIDDAEWDPATDPLIPHHFTADELEGKERCKVDLLTAAGLPYRHDVPLVGVVSRLAWQKGFDLCEEVLPAMLSRRRFQLAVLGTGERRYEDFFFRLAQAFPRQVAYLPAFSEKLAHTIEAASDLFLMPSRYEPCGLNQMYSLRYGTPPIVHRTGGLADTVWNWDPTTGRGTGFAFDHFDAPGLTWALGRALDLWGDGSGPELERWRQLQRNGMRLPLGWSHRIGEYLDLYRLVAPEA